MRILYYPGDERATEKKLYKFVTNELRRLSPKQWNHLDFFLYETQQGTLKDLLDLIQEENRKSRNKRRLAALGDDLYEYRGTQSHLGTIRVYFSYIKETVLILDAEYKTSDRNVIDRARARLKEMFTSKKEQWDDED